MFGRGRLLVLLVDPGLDLGQPAPCRLAFCLSGRGGSAQGGHVLALSLASRAQRRELGLGVGQLALGLAEHPAE